MLNHIKNTVLRTAISKASRFRKWRWFWPSAIAGGLAVLVPAYILASQLGAVPPALKPPHILGNPLSAVTKAATHALETATGQKQPGHPASSPSPTASQSANPRSNTPSATLGRQLILASPVLTIGNGSISDPIYRPSTTLRAASNVKLHNVVAAGPQADVAVLILPNTQTCADAYDSICSEWNVSAQRLHPEGSGTSEITITAVDNSGSVYSTLLTVRWPPTAYYIISNATAHIGTGAAGLGSPVPAVILDYDLSAGPNFGTHKLTMSAAVQWPYSCAGAPGVSQTISYNGAPTHVTLTCALVGDLNLERNAGGTIGVNVTSDLFTDFQSTGASASIPKW